MCHNYYALIHVNRSTLGKLKQDNIILMFFKMMWVHGVDWIRKFCAGNTELRFLATLHVAMLAHCTILWREVWELVSNHLCRKCNFNCLLAAMINSVDEIGF
jgi:hypothetical protein